VKTTEKKSTKGAQQDNDAVPEHVPAHEDALEEEGQAMT